MPRLPWLLVVVLALAVAALSAFAGYTHLRTRWQRAEADTPVTRGRDLAVRLGCFGCHGPGGVRPIPNPGAQTGEVPDWSGGTWMMWNRSEDDVESWIRNGHPLDRSPDEGALIPMPAYGQWLSEAELDDLTAYVLAVSQFGWPEEPGVAEGREVAVQFGCFGCHGPEGRGRVSNPGSFRGYIPEWDGPDYAELVESDDEFREWVRDGIIKRFRANPAARHFLETQAIQMPAYGERITDEQLDHLLAYVRWVRANPRGRP